MDGVAEASKGSGKGPPCVLSGKLKPTSAVAATSSHSLGDSLQSVCLRKVPEDSTRIARVQDISEPMDQICFTDDLEKERSENFRSALYLGGIDGALMHEALEVRNVLTVVSILHEFAPQVVPAAGVEYWRCPPVEDTPGSADVLAGLLDEAHRRIDEGLTRGSVLVHCMMGVSRSSTVVISYMMRTLGIGRDVALKRVQRCRSRARPNAGFFELLGRLQQQYSDEAEMRKSLDR